MTTYSFENGYRLEVTPIEWREPYDEVIYGASLVYEQHGHLYSFTAYENLPVNSLTYFEGRFTYRGYRSPSEVLEAYARYLRIFEGFNVVPFREAGYSQGDLSTGYAYSKTVTFDSGEGKAVLADVGAWLRDDIFWVELQKAVTYVHGDKTLVNWEGVEDCPAQVHLVPYGDFTADMLAEHRGACEAYFESTEYTPGHQTGISDNYAKPVLDYLTDINAHTLEAMLDWTLNGNAGGYSGEKLERAYEAARRVLAE